MDDGLLIDQVRHFVFLYDKSHRDFKNKVAKENAWKTIGGICGETAEEVEKRWNILRNRYNSERRKIRCVPSGSDSSKTVIWIYFENMKFLDTHIVARRTKSNYTKENILKNDFQFSPHQTASSSVYDSFKTIINPAVHSAQEYSDEDITEDLTQNSSESLQEKDLGVSDYGEPSGEPKQKKTKILKESNLEVNKAEPRKEKGKSKQEDFGKIVSGAMENLKEMLKEPEDDEDTLFARSVALSLKGLKSKKIKSKAKVKILSIIEESVIEDES